MNYEYGTLVNYEYGTLEYAIDTHLRKHDDATRPKRVAEVCALVNAKLGPAEIAPEPTVEELLGPKPYDGPGEDAGPKLKGILCFVWGVGMKYPNVRKIEHAFHGSYHTCTGSYSHARPVALGLPEWLKA